MGDMFTAFAALVAAFIAYVAGFAFLQAMRRPTKLGRGAAPPGRLRASTARQRRRDFGQRKRARQHGATLA